MAEDFYSEIMRRLKRDSREKLPPKKEIIVRLCVGVPLLAYTVYVVITNTRSDGIIMGLNGLLTGARWLWPLAMYFVAFLPGLIGTFALVELIPFAEVKKYLKKFYKFVGLFGIVMVLLGSVLLALGVAK